MCSHGNPRSADRGKQLSTPPNMQTLRTLSSPSSMPQSADSIVSTLLTPNALTRGSPPSDSSTPTGTKTTTEAPLGLTERTHNLRKRRKRWTHKHGRWQWWVFD
jgi:hypothetical protein